MELKRLSKSKVKEFHSLQLKKRREETGLFLAEGRKCITDLLPRFELEALVATESCLIQNPALRKFEDKIYLSPEKRFLGQISSLSTPPEIIAVFRMPENERPSLKLEGHRNYLLLDDIQDPGNLGTIIRTADWFGVYEIFASRETVDQFNPKVVQSTMGSLSRVNIYYVDLLELIRENPDISVYGTLLSGLPLKECNPSEKGLIMMGNEGKGISEELKKEITIPVTIPPYNVDSHPDSLNVAIAAGIILSHFQA